MSVSEALYNQGLVLAVSVILLTLATANLGDTEARRRSVGWRALLVVTVLTGLASITSFMFSIWTAVE